MKKSLLALAIVALASLAGTEANAQVGFGAHASFASETDLGIGGRINIPTPVANLSVVPTVDIFFPSSGVSGVSTKWYELNGNVAYSFPLPNNPKFLPYAGGGLNIVRLTASAGGTSVSDNEMGLNLLGGVKFGTGPFRPFAELRFATVADGQIILTGGINF